MQRRNFLKTTGLAAATVAATATAKAAGKKKSRPNILWIYIEDICPFLSCYGYKNNPTPHIDGIAQNGVKFSRAFSPTAVCSPTRSALITGMMPTTIGVHHHHSSRTVYSGIWLPEHIKTLPEIFQEHGYFTFNLGKDDYNFMYDRKKLYNNKIGMHFWYTFEGLEGDWRGRKKDQPFFGQIHSEGGKHTLLDRTETYHKDLPENERIDRNAVEIPPYYPDVPEIREDYARHFDGIRITDKETGRIMKQLQRDGLLDNTVVFFFSDHAYKGTRHKQFCYDSSLHVPLLVAWYGNPDVTPPGSERNDIVSLVDVSATSLALAGIPVPEYMESKNLFAKGYKRDYVIGARDRADFSIDMIRTVRTDRYRYLKNFMTDRPMQQPCYRDTRIEFTIQKEMHEKGLLNPAQDQFWAEERIPEELYDLKNDPHEINNLAGDPQYANVLDAHRKILKTWMKETDDQGQYPEWESPVGIENLRFMVDRWGARCVNPEFKAVFDNPMPGAPKVDIRFESP